MSKKNTNDFLTEWIIQAPKDGYDEDEDEDDVRDETIHHKDIDEEFMEQIFDLKHKIYEMTILSHDYKKDKGQDLALLNNYTNMLRILYQLCQACQSCDKKDCERIYQQKTNEIPAPLQSYMEASNKKVNSIMNWINTFYKTNAIRDTIPYTRFIYMALIEYPYIQDNSFMPE